MLELQASRRFFIFPYRKGKNCILVCFFAPFKHSTNTRHSKITSIPAAPFCSWILLLRLLPGQKDSELLHGDSACSFHPGPGADRGAPAAAFPKGTPNGAESRAHRHVGDALLILLFRRDARHFAALWLYRMRITAICARVAPQEGLSAAAAVPVITPLAAAQAMASLA
jgi:hypothetical protein